MDILLSEKLKLHMRVARGWLLRKIKKQHGLTIDDIIFDLEHTSDKAVKKIWEIAKKNAEECIMPHQRNETKLWAAILLWILVKDTAYRDIFYAIAKEILDAKDDIYDNIAKLAKVPEHWYANAHKKSQDRTGEKQRSGELLDQGRSYDETIAVSSKQKPRLSKNAQDVEPLNIYK
jgi:hypothetical protein